MIFSDAMRSLKNDPSRTFFYFLTFFLTTMLLFLFFNLAAAEAAVHEEYIMTGFEANIMDFMEHGDIVNLMMAYVVVMCCVDLIFANSFFIRNKAEELAVRLVCGATFTQLAFYLLVQTFLLLLAAIPLGIGSAIALIPVLNNFVANVLHDTFVVTVDATAVRDFSIIIVMMVAWTTTLNLSFAYQNEAAAILNGTGTTREKTGSILGGILAKIPGFLKGLLGAGVIGFSLMQLIAKPQGTFGYGLMFLVGLELFMTCALIPLITRYIDHSGMKNPLTTIVMSFFREDLKVSRINLYLLVGNAVVLIGLLVMRQSNSIAVMMIMITYIVMNVMQAMALMFRLLTHLTVRSSEFNVLAQVGYDTDEQKKILVREMVVFFLFVFAVGAVLMGTAGFALYVQNLTSASMAAVIIAALLIPIAVIAVLSLFGYRNAAHIQDMIHSIEESRRF